tara:strand:+ start:489 stop:656 length:168 start_codon:yes stop_codon:yes gene_type:complete
VALQTIVASQTIVAMQTIKIFLIDIDEVSDERNALWSFGCFGFVVFLFSQQVWYV